MRTSAPARSYPKPRRPRRPLRRAAAAAALAGLAACTTTPVTGSRQFNLFSPEQDVELGRQAFSEVLAGERVVTSGPDAEMVRRVMENLVAVADDSGYEWEVALLENDQMVNAFALPGGKMAVYSGLLPVAQSEAGLAVVMGHEIGHVVAQHGTQRVSRAYGTELVLAMVDLGEWGELATLAYELLLELPYSREHETEADHIGLVYMARAGYDPRVALEFWERMSAGGGGGPPEFLSTHPSGESRIQGLRELMPEAVAIYQEVTGRP